MVPNLIWAPDFWSLINKNDMMIFMQEPNFLGTKFIPNLSGTKFLMDQKSQRPK